MAMAAGASVLRSVATRTMAQAQRRLPIPTSSGGASRFSTSTGGGGSMPPPANLRPGPQPHNKEVPSGWEWHRVIDGIIKAAPSGAFILFGCFIYVRFAANPAMDRMEAEMDAQEQALVTLRKEIKKSRESTRAMLLSNKKSQTEAADVSEGMMNL